MDTYTHRLRTLRICSWSIYLGVLVAATIYFYSIYHNFFVLVGLVGLFPLYMGAIMVYGRSRQSVSFSPPPVHLPLPSPVPDPFGDWKAYGDSDPVVFTCPDCGGNGTHTIAATSRDVYAMEGRDYQTTGRPARYERVLIGTTTIPEKTHRCPGCKGRGKITLTRAKAVRAMKEYVAKFNAEIPTISARLATGHKLGLLWQAATRRWHELNPGASAPDQKELARRSVLLPGASTPRTPQI